MSGEELRAALDGLARSWEREATRRESDETRRDDPTNLLAMGIFRTVAQEVYEALAAPSTPEPEYDADGDPIRPDPHSEDWYDGYAAGQREAAASTPKPRNPTGRTDLCPDCGHHLHRPNPGKCQWYDCPCEAAPSTEPAPKVMGDPERPWRDKRFAAPSTPDPSGGECDRHRKGDVCVCRIHRSPFDCEAPSTPEPSGLREALYECFDDEAFMTAHLNARSLADAVMADPGVRAALAAPSTPEPSGEYDSVAWHHREQAHYLAVGEPRTKAGRALLAGLRAYSMPFAGELVPVDLQAAASLIADIEAEARATPSTEPALNVARLGQAYLVHREKWHVRIAQRPEGMCIGECIPLIAGEYARLAESQPAPDTCGVLARCGRPKDHRGHHGGWRM